MGNQLTGLAAGAKTYKLPLGNRLLLTPVEIQSARKDQINLDSSLNIGLYSRSAQRPQVAYFCD